jgi:hypothetical protein
MDIAAGNLDLDSTTNLTIRVISKDGTRFMHDLTMATRHGDHVGQTPSSVWGRALDNGNGANATYKGLQHGCGGIELSKRHHWLL